MALTFPRAMPTDGAATMVFEIVRVDFASPEVGGRIGSVSAGFPRWRLRLSLGPMAREAGDAWRAFVSSLRGSARTFYARDLLREYPAAYPNGFGGMVRAGGGAFPADGAPSAVSLNGTRDVITLTGMPAGFELRLGDLIGFKWAPNRRILARVIEAGVASGGGVLVVTVEPPIPNLVPVDATMTLQRPDVVMRLIPDETDLGVEDTVETSGGMISALQEILA